MADDRNMNEILQKNPEDFQKQSIVRELIWKLLPAQLMSGLVAALSTVIVSVVVGNCLDSVSLASVGIASSVVGAITAIIEIFATGSRIQAGKAIGRGNMEEVDRIFSSCMISVVAVAVIITALSLLLPDRIAVLAGACGETVAPTAEYIRGMAIGIIPMMVVPTMIVFASMMGEIKQAVISALVLACAVLAFSLLNGKLLMGGIYGMGLSTSAANLVSLVYMLIVFHIKRNKMPGFVFSYFNIGKSGTLVKLGTPAAMIYILNVFRNVILNTAAADVGGSEFVAGMAIRATAYLVLYCFEGAVATTAIMLASTMIGEGDSRSLRTLVKECLLLGFAGNVIIYGLSAILAVHICQMFGAEDMTLVYAVLSLRWLLISFMPDIVLTLLSGIHQCFGRIWLANVVYILAIIVGPVISAMIIAPAFGATGLLTCFATGELLGWMALFIYAVVKSGHFPRCIDDIIAMRGEMEVDNVFSYTAKTMDEVLQIADKVRSYCSECGADPSSSIMTAVCLEEMAVNVVRHGFSESRGNRDHSVDIFVMVRDDKILMKLKDDCIEFDPRARLDSGDPNDINENFGIKTVCNLADDMEYQNVFGMNVTTIILSMQEEEENNFAGAKRNN